MGVHGTFDLAGNVVIDHQREFKRVLLSLGTCSVLRVQGMLIVPRQYQPLVGTSALSPVRQYNSILISDVPVSILVCYLALVSEYLASCSHGFSLFSCTLD